MHPFLRHVVIALAAAAALSWLVLRKGDEPRRADAAVPQLAPLLPAVGAPALAPPAPALPAAGPKLTFHGFSCGHDCSGHEAGYAWAERHNADSESTCTGESSAFMEGCLAYVREQKGEAIEE